MKGIWRLTRVVGAFPTVNPASAWPPRDDDAPLERHGRRSAEVLNEYPTTHQQQLAEAKAIA